MFNFLRKLSKKESKSLEECLAQNGRAFDSQEAAEDYFFAERDKDLDLIKHLNESFPELDLNFKAKSLQRFEALYFNVFVDKTIKLDLSKEKVELLLTQYMRQIFVSNEMAEWEVFENDYAEGRYDLGLMLGYGAGTLEHYANDLDKKEDNTNRSFLFDRFMLYVPAEREADVL